MSDFDITETTKLQTESQLADHSETNLASLPSDNSVKPRDLESESELSHSYSPSESSIMSAASRYRQPSGDRLQLISRQELLESGANYHTFLQQLQIKTDRHDEVVTGILKPLRSKRIKNLKTATDAMIKNLSYAFIRGYGKILYKSERQKWLIPDIELQQSGKRPLLFSPGRYEIAGPNAHFYDILEPLWWHMRSVIFQPKPSPQLNRLLAQETNTNLEDNDPSDLDADRGGNGSRDPNYRMTAEETGDALCDLIIRLHQIRCQSHPDVFKRYWEIKMSRLDEIENIEELRTDNSLRSPNQQSANEASDLAAPRVSLPLGAVEAENETLPTSQEKTMVQLADEQNVVTYRNLANEPFNSCGPPSVLNQLGISHRPLIPSFMSVYITTNPPVSPYEDSSYHWPDGPTLLNDCDRFFNGIDQRVDVRQIQGYALSYGWNDVMRLIKNGKEERERGFAMFHRDIVNAAKKGVTTWRLKVLVFGEAPDY